MRFYNEQHEFYVGIDLVAFLGCACGTQRMQGRCLPASSTAMVKFFFIAT